MGTRFSSSSPLWGFFACAIVAACSDTTTGTTADAAADVAAKDVVRDTPDDRHARHRCACHRCARHRCARHRCACHRCACHRCALRRGARRAPLHDGAHDVPFRWRLRVRRHQHRSQQLRRLRADLLRRNRVLQRVVPARLRRGDDALRLHLHRSPERHVELRHVRQPLPRGRILHGRHVHPARRGYRLRDGDRASGPERTVRRPRTHRVPELGDGNARRRHGLRDLRVDPGGMHPRGRLHGFLRPLDLPLRRWRSVRTGSGVLHARRRDDAVVSLHRATVDDPNRRKTLDARRGASPCASTPARLSKLSIRRRSPRTRSSAPPLLAGETGISVGDLDADGLEDVSYLGAGTAAVFQSNAWTSTGAVTDRPRRLLARRVTPARPTGAPRELTWATRCRGRGARGLSPSCLKWASDNRGRRRSR